jgi:hypothetical protein
MFLTSFLTTFFISSVIFNFPPVLLIGVIAILIIDMPMCIFQVHVRSLFLSSLECFKVPPEGPYSLIYVLMIFVILCIILGIFCLLAIERLS